MFSEGLLAIFLCLGIASALPSVNPRWQPAESHVALLFRRGESDPSDPNWASSYPGGGSTPATSSIPSAWLDKLASVSVPSISVASPNNGYPTYANGESGADSTICSFTYQCATSDDLYNPPDGVLALAFDDGPSGGSDTLYTFLETNNISSKATHFMIGGNILSNPTAMQRAVSDGGHIAVHTWSHPYMTTLTNEQVVAELGWTMQIISDLNGGRLPKYWRPPYGDVDNRVRAIAKGVFGLETVPWNQDSGDWAIGNNPAYTLQSVEASMDGWLSGSKSPGLSILEHELNENTVGVFMTEYPKMVSNGWDIKAVPDVWSMEWYQNSDGNTDAVSPMSVAANSLNLTDATSSASASVSTASSNANITVSSSSASSTDTVSSTTSALTTSSASATDATHAAAAASSKSAARLVVAMPGWAAFLGLVAAAVA